MPNKTSYNDRYQYQVNETNIPATLPFLVHDGVPTYEILHRRHNAKTHEYSPLQIEEVDVFRAMGESCS